LLIPVSIWNGPLLQATDGLIRVLAAKSIREGLAKGDGIVV